MAGFDLGPRSGSALTPDETRLIDEWLACKAVTVCPPMQYSLPAVGADGWRGHSVTVAKIRRREARFQRAAMKRGGSMRRVVGFTPEIEAAAHRQNSIISRYNAGLTSSELAAEFGVCAGTIKVDLRVLRGAGAISSAAERRERFKR